MTPSRRHQFAVPGLVLALAAFAAAPAMAASSTALHNHKSSHHVSHATHKVKPHHSSSVHNVAHHSTHSTHKVTAS